MTSDEHMRMSAALERGRECYEQRAWAQAFEAFSCADERRRLERRDLERLAWSAALTGKDEAFASALERLHQLCLDANECTRAARAAFWIGFHFFVTGSSGRAAGWFARAQRLIESEGEDCVERGYLLLPAVLRHLHAGDEISAHDMANEAAEIAERCKDGDLVALTRNLQGRALVRMGRFQAGLALLDEAMVAAASGELSPFITGIVYCHAIATCQQIQAVDRAREWTAVLARWCDEQPELVTFTGLCLVHRCEILQLAGDWAKAIEELRLVAERGSKLGDPEVFGDACYQRAELLRLRGDFNDAERAYRLASENGREPQPGLSLLRLAQGETTAAVNAIRRVASATTEIWQRARLLPALIEITLAAGELEEARKACGELEEIAQRFETEILGAMAAHARGAVALAEGDARAAIEPLRRAFVVWNKVGAPYIAARIRVLLARGFRALGDQDGANLELDAARQVFQHLGARPDLAASAVQDRGAGPTRGLSTRELEVLRLLARGKTNKFIARELRLSERTVDRHVSNIFMKIDVGSRAAATAFAYQNKLV